MHIVTKRLSASGLSTEIKKLVDQKSLLTLALIAEDRTRSRHRFMTVEGEEINLQLQRGTVLREGDILADEQDQAIAIVIAKPEPVVTVTAKQPLEFLRAAYHLGNRHISLEITENYLRLSPDSVLEDMVLQMGLTITHETQPFQPESGAYHHHHDH
ncbi:MAG: urease accessory protein UreE [Pseudanabaena sp.]|jgi:urease accessory protein|nr:urease accessory protein UreE [Pseudanabaena sp. M172S2SP2A07QC]MCA6521338.1 urease accessory protein UreE [Pseudanabaena sp. M051S1SP2A07QC]MCA6527670.1 urease accessory protein UreE [Pseudanabaena sp. M179S2SP2A07QC]MCA6530571.1 urease accessory protein UreE [Pseudanabaena sp. M125S2SP2A07QC]MCA6534890.1 urease accessory protein UreE [Pseudanabaena sp. M176S2SP2A07QC]MCA6539632.1 urease accessory protein UreE [Pseudanabaena sp. M037S2SP2A07QC]MCA6543794.1 urease accessory protein UreE [P